MPLPAPLQPLRCGNPDCTLPEGGRCARISEFPNPLADCTELTRQSASAAVASASGLTAPWSGRHLDPVEAGRLLWSSPARLVGVLGPFNAGKTSLLASFFLQLANGQRGAFPYRFASSRTLHGFRELMERAHLWSGEAQEDIVLHTTVGAEEFQPRSFLHVGLRPQAFADDRHIDLLLSDLPGEWVKAWSGHVDDTARRRLAFIQRCDAFLVLADTSALMGTGGNRVDNETAVLLRRVIDVAKETKSLPPLALILSKFDRVVGSVAPPSPEKRAQRSEWGALAGRLHRTWNALEDARQAGLPVDIFPVSAFPRRMAEGQPVGVMAPFIFAMQHVDSRERWAPRHVPIPEDARGFATMRRWRDEP